MRDILAALAAHALSDPARPAVIDATRTMTYGGLADEVRRTAAWAQSLPPVVGLMAPKDRRGVVWSLALAWAGRTVVPLPDFFSPAQLAHMAADAGIGGVVAAPDSPAADALGLPLHHPAPDSRSMAEPSGGNRWIIYTSGTTGRPKGVILDAPQIDASVQALAAATDARSTDRMLSVLPPALLLDLVAGIALPLAVGASLAMCPDPRHLAMAAATATPTATVLVPELLAAWVAGLERAGQKAPASLRFVAVGGAPVTPDLAARAWAVGLPVHEGYGLSECCSVVAVNRPGSRASGTVGRPLPGVTVSIENGEIVVAGPTVMSGYLGGAPVAGPYRTGDAGHFDEDGNLVVSGRIDDIIVTAAGRNLHPEWIEAMILKDPRVARCAVVDGGGHPRALLVPADGAGDLGDPDLLVGTLTAEAPAYARPRSSLTMTGEMLARHGLITPTGRLRRRAIATHLEDLSR
jgi:long-subunit acyl-CoA synthetase (AMP-forming)